jgi:hypothetical protein
MRRRRRRTDDAYVEERDEVIEDGGVVRCPVVLMDSMQRRVAFDAANHQPGYRFAAAADATVRDARRHALDARDAMIKRAENAWRSDARRKPPDDDDDDDDDDDTNSRERSRDARDARAAATASYIAMCARLRDAWRSSPSRDGAGGPDAEALLARHLRGDEPDDDDDNGNNTADLREQSYAAYKDQLENAWRGGRTDPSRAVEVERRLERERGKYA